MINKWILNNFKAINREQELHFRPLTIFTGANSSGKSTILQSILLVTQTLQDQIESRSIVLNGWFKKFGSYSDIVFHREDEMRNIKIGFDISDVDIYSVDFMRFVRFYRDINNASCSFVISSGGKKESLWPVLEELNLSSNMGTEGKEKTELRVVHNPDRSDLEKKVIEQGKRTYDENYFDYSITIKGGSYPSIHHNTKKWNYIGCSLSHFLPNNIVRYTVTREYIKDKLTNYLMYDRSSPYDLNEVDLERLNPLLKDRAIEIIHELRSNGKLDVFGNDSYVSRQTKLYKKFTIQQFYALFKKSTLNGDEKREYINHLLKSLSELPESYMIDMEPVNFTYAGSSFVKNFFSRRIKYLGPLREEPKSLYPLETGNTPMELGLKGENTAAVYENNKKRIIEYVDPSYFENGAMGDPKILSGRLSEAVAKWLVYLGVATRVTTDDRGKMGHELKIMNELGDIRQDLTHVGVGVSQVLPILVMAFLAGKGDVIILEQPELHLHPKVQTRLADFFVSMTQLGKQCLIETHSEYFINRLRYRVAVADNDSVANNTMIYFVEKDRSEGVSKYREVTINRYGVIEDWPEGFFDEGERIAAEILRAGMQKKMQEEEYEE